jgi:ATP-dependent Clp protease ATP-binding subunit ClpC
MKSKNDSFTKELQETSLYIDEILQRYNHNQIDTEHILLALLEKSQETIFPLLKTLSADKQSMINQLTDVLSRFPRTSAIKDTHIYITPRTKQIFHLANEAAISLNDKKISSQHFLLAILTEHNTLAAKILASTGLTYDRVYSAIQELRKKQDIN